MACKVARQSAKSLATLAFDDEPAVINAADSIAQIGAPLSDAQCIALLNALDGSDNQKRSVIQTHTRLKLPSGESDEMERFVMTGEIAGGCGACKGNAEMHGN